jgi:putative colanic acid biosynthesis acetyltransferase WcaF
VKEYRYINRLPLANRLKRLLWGVCRMLLFRPTPRWALHTWRAVLLRWFGAEIGIGCRIDPRSCIWAPWNLSLGDFVSIGENVDVYNVARITIGSKAAISQRAFLCTASHDISSLSRPLTHAPIEIGQHAWIAAEAMLYPGATVEDGAIVAARAVLRGRAAAWTIWAGNPAREVGKRTLRPEHPTDESGNQGPPKELP